MSCVDLTHQHFTDRHLSHSTSASATDRDHVVLTLSLSHDGSRRRVVPHGSGVLLTASRWPSHSISSCRRCRSSCCSSSNRGSNISNSSRSDRVHHRRSQPVNDHSRTHAVSTTSRRSLAAKNLGKLGGGRSRLPCRACMGCSQTW